MSQVEQVGAGGKIFLLKKVFICSSSVNYRSVIEMKNITESCVREKSHIFLDVAWFALSMNMRAKVTEVVVMKIFIFVKS